MAQVYKQKMTADIDGEFVVLCVYGAMPRFGLGKAARHVPAAGVRDSARGRMAVPAGIGS